MASGGGEGHVPLRNPRLNSSKHWGFVGGGGEGTQVPSSKIVEGPVPPPQFRRLCNNIRKVVFDSACNVVIFIRNIQNNI